MEAIHVPVVKATWQHKTIKNAKVRSKVAESMSLCLSALESLDKFGILCLLKRVASTSRK